MSECPQPEHLRSFLADRIPWHERQAIDAHVQGCPECQRLLEQLEGEGRGDFEEIYRRSREPVVSTENEQDRRCLEELKGQLPPIASARDQAANSALAATVSSANAALNGVHQAPAPPHVIIPAATTLPPDFELLCELGHGGMGIVYKVRQHSLCRIVALKMIRETGKASQVEIDRLVAEAQAAAKLQHPNIVQIHQVDKYNDQPYLVLEYVDGGTLAERIQGTVRVSEAVLIVKDLALAVEVAHKQGIVHRDLKPANILLSAHGTLKIADFGLAKRQQDGSNRPDFGVGCGTPEYMAPEQLEPGAPVGPPADVYGLGGILYRMLTGHTPFESSSVAGLLEQVRSSTPSPPSSRRSEVPGDLDTVVLKCLQKDPKDRYENVGALAEDLHRFLRARRVSGRPYVDAARWRRWCGINWRLAAAGILVLVVLVVGSGLAMSRWALDLEQEANRSKDDRIALEEESSTLRELLSAMITHRDQFAAEPADLLIRAQSETNYHQQIKSQLEKVKTLLGRVRSHATTASSPRETDLVIRLAEGAVDQAERRFKSVLEKVREEDAAESIGRAVQIYRSRGDAHAELYEWQEALQCYQNVLRLQPDGFLADIRVANCLSRLGRLRESLAEYEKAIDRRTKLVAQGQENVQTQLASALNGRANALKALDELGAALKDYDEAVRIYERSKLKSELAKTLNNRGIAHKANGSYPRAFKDYDQAIAIYELVLRQAGNEHLDVELARTLTNRGSVYRDQGNLPDALRDHNRAIALYRKLIDHQKQGHLVTDLALCLDNRAKTYREKRELDLALKDHEECLTIYTDLRRGGRHEYMEAPLAQCRAAHGSTLSYQHDWAGAVKSYDAAENAYARLVQQEQYRHLTTERAINLNNRGNAFTAQGRLQESLRDLNQAVEVFKALVENVGRKAHERRLANSMYNRGNVRRGQLDLPGAFEDHDGAVAILERLVLKEGRAQLRDELARSLDNRGATRRERRAPGDLEAAVRDHDQAVDIFKELIEKGGQKQLENELARCQRNRGNAFWDQKRFADALKDHEAAVATYTKLVEKEKQTQFESRLAETLGNRATTLYSQQKWTMALADLDKSIGILTRLIEKHGRSDLEDQLGTMLDKRASVHRALRKFHLALQDYDQSVAVITRLVHQQGHIHLRSMLAGILTKRAAIRLGDRNPSGAIEDYEQSVDLFRALSAQPGGERFTLKLAEGLNGLAWQHATAHHAEFRNGTKALQYAVEACKLTQEKDFSLLDTLAAAHAESGDFESAVIWQKKSMELGPPDHQADLRSRLELYQKRMPYRQLAN